MQDNQNFEQNEMPLHKLKRIFCSPFCFSYIFNLFNFASVLLLQVTLNQRNQLGSNSTLNASNALPL